MKTIAIYLGAQVVALIFYAAFVGFVVWGRHPAEWTEDGRFFVALFWLCISGFTALVTFTALEEPY